MPDDTVLNSQIILHFNKFKQIQSYPNNNNKMTFLIIPKYFLGWEEEGRVWAPGNETDPNLQPPPSACGNVTSTEMCHLQEHQPANTLQMKTGRNCFFPL